MSEPAPPVANMVTIGARDFPALVGFYRGLGWPEAIVDDQFVVFDLRGLFLALFPRTLLARDGNTEPAAADPGIRLTIGITVAAPEDVDALTEQMRRGGARVTKEPVDAEYFTGRSAYLCDPEDNFFEITWADLPDHPVVAAARRAART